MGWLGGWAWLVAVSVVLKQCPQAASKPPTTFVANLTALHAPHSSNLNAPPQDFTQNHIHTGWLDSRIAANVKAERPPWHLCVIGSAVVRAYESITSKAAEYLGFLSKGQLPPRDVGLIHFSDDLVLEGVKYHVSVVRR